MTTTRWWWIRHAPVVGHGGRIYGQDDLACDCSDAATFQALARRLPPDAVWVTSHLRRTHDTARAILAHRDQAAPEIFVEAALAEQNLGAWQGMTNDEVAARAPDTWHRFWLAPAAHAPPGGESFLQVIARVSAVVERFLAVHGGRDIVAVAHGGTIRAALAVALALEADRALAFAIDHCTLTCIEHIPGPPGSHAPETDGAWRVRAVNMPVRVV